MSAVLLGQLVSLLGCIAYHGVSLVLCLPLAVFRSVLAPLRQSKQTTQSKTADSCVFYEGSVYHIRRKPKENSFRYEVRSAVISLDQPPAWFKWQSQDHMTADQARQYAGTKGPVRLLTNPASAGYIQNPISVYYCHDSEGKLERCISEVTNTPWGERVTFVFRPEGEYVKKALHVSPFMDMENTWYLEAPAPADSLKLVVNASHPQHGAYFNAALTARRSGASELRSEEAGLGRLLKYGFQPHRVAILIYWQAIKLLVKGVPFYSPPTKVYRDKVPAGAKHPNNAVSNCPFTWREAKSWPWNAEL